MTGQLSLFDWIEPDSQKEISAANKSIEPTLIMNESSIDETNFSQSIDNNKKNIEKARYEDLYIGQVVRIPLPHEDTELYDFLKYYYPYVINKTGEIEDITFNKQGDCICTVNVKGEKLLFYASELAF